MTMKWLRYASRRIAEASVFGLVFFLWVFISLWVGDQQELILLTPYVGAAATIVVLATRMTPWSWEDQSFRYTLPKEREHFQREAARLDRQWFKWW